MNFILNVWHIFLIIYYKLAFVSGGFIDEEYYVKTAAQYMELNNFKRAILNLEKALKTYDVSYIRNNIAWCYLKLGEYEKAIIQYDKAYEKKKDGTFLIYSAYCKYFLGNKDDAFKMISDIKLRHTETTVLKELERIEKCIRDNENTSSESNKISIT